MLILFFRLFLFIITIPIYSAETTIISPTKPQYFTKEQIENLNLELFLKPTTGNVRIQYLENLNYFAQKLFELSKTYQYCKNNLHYIQIVENTQDQSYPIKDPFIKVVFFTEYPKSGFFQKQTKWGTIYYIFEGNGYRGCLAPNTPEGISINLQISSFISGFAMTSSQLLKKKLESFINNIQKYFVNENLELQFLSNASVYIFALRFLYEDRNSYLQPTRSHNKNTIIDLLLKKFPGYTLVTSDNVINQEIEYRKGFIDKYSNFKGIFQSISDDLTIIKELTSSYQLLYNRIIKAIDAEISQEKSIEKRKALYVYKKDNTNTNLPNTITFEDVISTSTQDPQIDIVSSQKKSPKKSTPSRTKKSRSRPKRKEIEEISASLSSQRLTSSAEIEVATNKVAQKPLPIPVIKISYAPRVERWFDDSFAETQSYDNVLYHSFSQLTDKYLLSLGRKIPYANRTIKNQIDTQYSLLGQVIYNDGTIRLGIFHLTVDPKNVCYHRGIMFNINRDSLFEDYFKDDFWRTTDQTDEGIEDINTSRFMHHIDKESFVEKEDNFVIKIRDNRLDATFILFKPAPSL